MIQKFSFVMAAILILVLPFRLSAQTKWVAEIPKEASDAKTWQDLVGYLDEHDLPFSALAAASRMLIFFQDLPSKEVAYKEIIKLIDEGYPFSTLGLFMGGDIEPHDDYNFINSYNLYKAILNRDRGMERWAQNYFTNLDKENFPKYLFYTALGQYSDGKLEDAEASLKKILSKDLPLSQHVFVVKVMRTLARVYFDQEEYEKSYDIYSSFLLKLNPVAASDWLEAAWNLYHLKRYQEALGFLFNFQSLQKDSRADLEQYMIRALIYKELCAAAYADSLNAEFKSQFGPTIDAIKHGESLKKYPVLKNAKIPANISYQEVEENIDHLTSERKLEKNLPPRLKELAHYFYESELKMRERQLRYYEPDALDRAANQLVMASEQLRFLRFGVDRQTFNPDVVFRGDSKTAVVDTLKDENFQIHWAHKGDFWRDERMNFKGLVSNQCKK